VAQAREEATLRGIENLTFDVMNAERMEFPAASFDLVCGFGILHHLDLEKSLREIARVLKPTGRAVFLEPLGHNPAINLFRRLTPSIRTPDEHPLRMSDLYHIKEHFGDVEATYLNLTTLAATPFIRLPGVASIQRGLAVLDKGLFSAIPALRRFAWNVVLDMGEPRVVRCS
jgi:SAM-dependent methyltransferase